MNKASSKDWWLGRTPEWQARQQRVRDAGESMQQAGRNLTRYVWRWMFIAVGAAISLLALGLPLVFGVICALLAPSRGRRWDTGLAFGMWLPAIYLIYLLTREKT